ncbi:MAG: hypothetical protein M3526_05080 [Actinomycetota bacterium]|nr:hypothetical protein [Actinomycetota bacterium]
MLRKTKWVAGGIVAVAVLGVGTGIGVASSDDGRGTPITGGALEKASVIALERTGGTRVNQTELRDEEGYFEVEVVLEDGSVVDVHLDRRFNVISGGDGGREGPENDSQDD